MQRRVSGDALASASRTPLAGILTMAEADLALSVLSPIYIVLAGSLIATLETGRARRTTSSCGMSCCI